MNAKKVKKLRALVKHLQKNGAVDNTWERQLKLKNGTLINDPKSGKAVYKSMKEREQLIHPV